MIGVVYTGIAWIVPCSYTFCKNGRGIVSAGIFANTYHTDHKNDIRYEKSPSFQLMVYEQAAKRIAKVRFISTEKRK